VRRIDDDGGGPDHVTGEIPLETKGSQKVGGDDDNNDDDDNNNDDAVGADCAVVVGADASAVV